MSLRINDEAPNFTAETTQGTINFHDWIGNGWAVLFSHPKDFTPVCTTELGYMAGLKPRVRQAQLQDPRAQRRSGRPTTRAGRRTSRRPRGTRVTYPMVGDPELKVATLTTCCRPTPGDLAGPHRRRQRHGPLGLRDRPGQEDQGDADLSDEHRAQLRRGAAHPRLGAADRQAPDRDPGQLEAGRRCHHRAGGLGRGRGESYPGGFRAPKPYLRIVPQPQG